MYHHVLPQAFALKYPSKVHFPAYPITNNVHSVICTRLLLKAAATRKDETRESRSCQRAPARQGVEPCGLIPFGCCSSIRHSPRLFMGSLTFIQRKRNRYCVLARSSSNILSVLFLKSRDDKVYMKHFTFRSTTGYSSSEPAGIEPATEGPYVVPRAFVTSNELPTKRYKSSRIENRL